MTVEPLHQRTGGDQAKRIHKNVHEADVEEHRREQPPDLMLQGDGEPEVAPACSWSADGPRSGTPRTTITTKTPMEATVKSAVTIGRKANRPGRPSPIRARFMSSDCPRLCGLPHGSRWSTRARKDQEGITVPLLAGFFDDAQVEDFVLSRINLGNGDRRWAFWFGKSDWRIEELRPLLRAAPGHRSRSSCIKVVRYK